MARALRPWTAGAQILVLPILLTAPTAWADLPKVLVLPYQHLNDKMPEDLGEQTTVVVTREMAHGGLEVIRTEDVGAPAPRSRKKAGDQNAPTGDPKAGREAEQLIVDAKDKMQDSEFEGAAKLLKRAVRLLEKNADAVPDLRLLPEAYLQLGVAYFRDGLEDEGDEMLNKAAHLDPERALSEADYPPIFIKVYDRARFNVLRRPRAQIEVKATPGAQVLFDGRNMGKAPVLLKDALPGEHWIRVERPGEAPQVKKIKARGKRTIVVAFEGGDEGGDPSPAVGVLGAVEKNEIGPEHVKQLQNAGRRANADFVMIGAIWATDTAYQIRTAYVRVKDGTVGRLTNIAFDLDMLSAEIEVFKLAEDAKKQATEASFSDQVGERPFALAPKYKTRARRRRAIVGSGKKETRMSTAVAAPAPIKPPASLYAASAPPPPPDERKPVIEAPAKPTILPKDEVKPKEDPLASSSLVIKDEIEEDGEPSTWWIWTLVGVAAAGAAVTGGYFIAKGQSPDEGALTVRW